MLDNLSAHTGPAGRGVARAPETRAAGTLHFTPTASSWLNLVEGWFTELTDQRLRRGSFTSVDDLIDAIETGPTHWNDDPQPFVWTKPADEIIAKVRRGRAALDHQTKSATHH